MESPHTKTQTWSRCGPYKWEPQRRISSKRGVAFEGVRVRREEGGRGEHGNQHRTSRRRCRQANNNGNKDNRGGNCRNPRTNRNAFRRLPKWGGKRVVHRISYNHERVNLPNRQGWHRDRYRFRLLHKNRAPT